MENTFGIEIWRQHPEIDCIQVSSLARVKRVLKESEHYLKKEKQRYRVRMNGKNITLHIQSMMDMVFPELKYRHEESTTFNDFDGEIWRKSFLDNNYEVSNLGRVRRLDFYRKVKNYQSFVKGGICKQSLNKQGYLIVGFSNKNGKSKTYLVHQLVAKSFIQNPNNLKQINHKDGVKTNNKIENLEWCTASQNIKHSWDLGLRKRKV